jgi:hypothetical protein
MMNRTWSTILHLPGGRVLLGVRTQPLPQAGASFYVQPNQDPDNPLLDQEVAGKISAWLVGHGYRLATAQEADLILTYAYGLDYGESSVGAYTQPGVTTNMTIAAGSGFRGGGMGFGFSFGPGYPDYYYQPLIRHWLEIRVLDGPASRSGSQVPILWVGDAETFGDERNLRGVLDYLGRLWQDTGQAIRVVVPRSDPALKEIYGRTK